ERLFLHHRSPTYRNQVKRKQSDSSVSRATRHTHLRRPSEQDRCIKSTEWIRLTKSSLLRRTRANRNKRMALDQNVNAHNSGVNYNRPTRGYLWARGRTWLAGLLRSAALRAPSRAGPSQAVEGGCSARRDEESY